MRLQAAFARKFCGPFSARRAGTTSARFRLCNCFYRQAGRMLAAAGPHGFPTVVKQVAKFQNYNLSTFKFQCSPAWRSCSCWRCSNFARPTGFRHVGEVAFSTLLRSESRTLPDNPPLSENGAKKKTVCVLNTGGLFVYGRFQHRGSGLAKQNPPGSTGPPDGNVCFSGNA